MANCPVCSSSANIDNSNIHEPKIDCPQCGKFGFTETALNTIPKDVYPDWQNKLQQYILLNQSDDDLTITDDILKTIF